jgi:hypothetical protein
MLNFWDATWALDERLCACDVYFAEYLEQKGVKGASIFHFGTGSHHILALRNAQSGANNAILGITASPGEYEAYIKLLIENPRLGATYKAYFGDIYQLDPRLLPKFDYVTNFHACEFRTEKNDAYGALTDLEMTLVLADSIKPGGEMHFYTGSDGYKKTLAVIDSLMAQRGFTETGAYKTLRILTKPR